MKRKFLLYFSIWCLLSAIIMPIVIGTYLFFPNFYNINAVEILCATIFVSAYVLFPLFFSYQIIMRIKNKEKTKDFSISLATLVVILISILFYFGLYYLVERAITNTHGKESEFLHQIIDFKD